MKIRNGFVSNSSSSSFIIDGSILSNYQIKCIENIEKVIEFWKTLHINLENLNCTDVEDIRNWDIFFNNVSDDPSMEFIEISCSTSMNNFNLEEYLTMIGVPECAIKNRRY